MSIYKKRDTPYKKDGITTYTASQKIAYHKNIADTGKKDGKKIGYAERIRHGVLAKQNADKLNKFMSYSSTDREKIVLGQKPANKPVFIRQEPGVWKNSKS